MSPEQYVAQRVKYMAKERAFRKKIEVIVKRPVGYQRKYDIEVWNDGEQYKWDAKREFNGDEVPFIIDMDSKQIVSEGERASVLKKGLQRTGKYRQGTLFILTFFKGILFVVIIFPNGGKVVAAKLAKLIGNLKTKVYWVCSESGSMTTPIWVKVMTILQNRTKGLRGCLKQNGSDWKKAIVLNIDNYKVHLNVQIASEYAKKYGIFIRCLLKNASHLQQPIDQHIGLLLKKRIKEGIQQWLIKSNIVRQHNINFKITAQKWREMVVSFVKKGVKDLDDRKYLNVFVLAWWNYGLYLNLDGNEDGDVNTLHIEQNNKLTDIEKLLRTKECIRKVQIRRNKNGLFERNWDSKYEIYEFQKMVYNINKACENSNVQKNQDDINLIYLKYDLARLNEKKLVKFMDEFKGDWTNNDNPMPDTGDMISPYEVLSLRKIYMSHGDDQMVVDLFTKDLGIPMRDDHANITHLPIMSQQNEEILTRVHKFQQQCEYNTTFIQDILEEVNFNWHSEEKQNGNDLVMTSLLTESDLKQLNEEEQIEIATILNQSANNQSYTQQELQTIVGWSWVLPNGKLQPNVLNAANWALVHGGKVGESQISYKRWHKLWQDYCEQSGPLSELDVTPNIEEYDLWIWLNEKLDNGEINNLKIGGNSSLRCWFLCILYFLIGEQQFMRVVYEKREETWGQRLLYKILQTLKIGVIFQLDRVLNMVTEFVEALLQGHYCYWLEYGSVETGFKILLRMAGPIFNEFTVDFNVWSNCRIHQRYKQKQHRAHRLGFDYRIDWKHRNGFITHYTQYIRKCRQILGNGNICSSQTVERIYEVISPQNSSFMMFFRIGIPIELWNQIMGGNLIYFGDEARQIGGAIFQVGSSHFVAAYLLNKPRSSSRITKIWYKLETLENEIQKFDTACREDIRFIFVHPPEISCFCDLYDDFNMVQCPNCQTWVHMECVDFIDYDNEYDGRNCKRCSEESE